VKQLLLLLCCYDCYSQWVKAEVTGQPAVAATRICWFSVAKRAADNCTAKMDLVQIAQI
jgi:hypothetical protein